MANVCVQNVLHVLEYKIEDVHATARSLHHWNVPTLISDATSADRRHEFGSGTHATVASCKSYTLPGWGCDDTSRHGYNFN